MRRSTIVALAAVAIAVSGLTAATIHADVVPSQVIEISHGSWSCSTPQDGTIVIVHNATRSDGVTPDDAIHLQPGCTGTIRSIIVDGTQQDGIKVGGANDLTILSGGVWCGPARSGIVHQDGIQAMAGTNVTFKNFTVDCPVGNNGGLWVEWNKAAAKQGQAVPTPTNIVCDNCDLRNANAALHIGADSSGSGAINSTLHTGTGGSAPADCTRLDPGAVNPVDLNNICIP